MYISSALPQHIPHDASSSHPRIGLQLVPSIRNDPRHGEYVYITEGITLGFELLTILVWCLVHVVYPMAIRRKWSDASQFLHPPMNESPIPALTANQNAVTSSHPNANSDPQASS